MPLVRRRVAEVIARSGVPADSHTGKELLDVLETYPRDELLQVGSDELLPVALAVLHLQERRQTRLFLRQDPTGRFWSALVYLPRDRYTTEVRLAMQQLLLERLGGTSVEYTARSTESVLARLHFVVRVPVGKRGTPKPMVVDVEALQAELAAAARSWTDDLADALAARHGDEAERLLARVADAFPAAYQEDFSAEQAVDDLARLDGLAEGQLALRLWTPKRRRGRRPPAHRLPGGGAAAAVRGAAGPAAHGRRRRRRAPLRDRPHRRPAGLDLRLRRRPSPPSSCRCCARCPSGSPRRSGRSGAARPRTTASARW